MPITLAAPKETTPGEKRIALTPEIAKKLQGLGLALSIESSMGLSIGFEDSAYKDVAVSNQSAQLVAHANIIIKVAPPSLEEIQQYPVGSILIGMLAPYSSDERIIALKEKGITSFSLELIPRISRAQSMDVLSSQAAAAGYQATLIAAELCQKFFPMLTTAAGTIRPAKVLIIGAGVAGLQAISTARRLGAIVEAYDVRSATKEQVESLGAKFIDTGVSADGAGGYARALTDEEKQQQQAVLDEHIAKSDVVITTAAIPGRPSPKIISRSAVEGMKGGSVIVDLAAEGGGNCELTKPGEYVVHQGVTVFGPLNLPSQLAAHASEMYAKNLFNFISLFVKEGEISLDWEDPIIVQSALTHNGKIVHEATAQRLTPASSAQPQEALS